MRSLIIQQNMNKRATEEDGPSFEQQFGILANAVISDKFPQLDSMKLAFQLIDKEDDNSRACGASVYIVGKTVIFVPAFFLNGNIKTADMMLLAETQQFLPMSDPWISWIKNKDIAPEAKIVDMNDIDTAGSTKATTIRYISDPIIKSASGEPKLHKSANVSGLYFWERACGMEKSAKMAEDVMKDSYSSMSSVYLKGLCKLDPDLKKTASDMNVLDTVLHMGNEATASMLDNMTKKDLLNATLSFYTPEQIQKFASVASTMDPKPAFQVILPFDKEAKELKPNEQKALYKDGFFIKAAAESKDVPTVIRKKKVNDLFSVLKEAGKTGLLQPDGTIKDAMVFMAQPDICYCGCEIDGRSNPINSYVDDRNGRFPPMPADMAEEPQFLIVADGKATKVRQGVMELRSDREEITDESFKSVGKPFKEAGGDKDERAGGWIVCSNGMAYYVWGLRKTAENTWKQGDLTFQLAEDDSKLKRPMESTGSLWILPADTRFIPNDDGKSPSLAFVTMGTLDAFIENYTQKNYKHARIYHNGSDWTVSGDNSEDGDKLLTMKEAALALVTDYGVAPADAKVILKDASNGATYDHPKSTQYLIQKFATLEDGKWEDSNIPMNQQINPPPQISQRSLPTIVEDPAQLEQAVTMAAQNGIKEVFDVTVLKLLVKQNRFFDEIHDDLPVFMQVLDSLCRKLFQFYWHTDKMEEKYGMVKLKSLEESLKVTLDSLSELTVFFKLRTVDGSGSTGDTSGDLMTDENY